MNHPFFCYSFRQEHFLIENQQSATDDRYGPCLYVDTETDGAFIKVTGCNETDERQSWYYTPKGQVKVVTMVGNIRTFFYRYEPLLRFSYRRTFIHTWDLATEIAYCSVRYEKGAFGSRSHSSVRMPAKLSSTPQVYHLSKNNLRCPLLPTKNAKWATAIRFLRDVFASIR